MALLGACLTLGNPLGSSAETSMTGSQQTALYQYSLYHFDAETRTLGSLKNHISSGDVIPVSVAGLRGLPPRRGGNPGISGTQRAALAAALSKATVADVDRNNGQSPDQSSLAEYLQHLRIDPAKVVAVDVNPKPDPQNPRVTVFYRR
ncbi:MAG TPA: hypothetical protein VN224_08705 [Xanthomonadales bacterium]|nr:hypothetical protein [Xanthomonadales bacterium]